MKNVFFLFCFYYLVNFILCQDNQSDNNITKCINNTKSCYNFKDDKCVQLTDFKNNYESLKSEENYSEDQVNCGTFFERCRQKNSNDIKENCYEVKPNNNDKAITGWNNDYECCYMTLKFKENKKHECYPAIADKKFISDIIDKLENEEYYELKSAKIKCGKSQYINFRFFILFNILFLF